MLDDIRRFRRHTGWTVSAELAGQVFRFKVSPAESAVTVTFLINTKWITQNLWSVYYGGDESIDQLRRKFLDHPRKGLAEICGEINAIPKVAPSRWTRLEGL